MPLIEHCIAREFNRFHARVDFHTGCYVNIYEGARRTRSYVRTYVRGQITVMTVTRYPNFWSVKLTLEVRKMAKIKQLEAFTKTVVAYKKMGVMPQLSYP